MKYLFFILSKFNQPQEYEELQATLLGLSPMKK